LCNGRHGALIGELAYHPVIQFASFGIPLSLVTLPQLDKSLGEQRPVCGVLAQDFLVKPDCALVVACGSFLYQSPLEQLAALLRKHWSGNH